MSTLTIAGSRKGRLRGRSSQEMQIGRALKLLTESLRAATDDELCPVHAICGRACDHHQAQIFAGGHCRFDGVDPRDDSDQAKGWREWGRSGSRPRWTTAA